VRPGCGVRARPDSRAQKDAVQPGRRDRPEHLGGDHGQGKRTAAGACLLAQALEQVQPGAVAEPQSGQVQDQVTASLGQRHELPAQAGGGSDVQLSAERDDDRVTALLNGPAQRRPSRAGQAPENPGVVTVIPGWR
jgi:hypothetical protein